jgi:hypothetical protein
MLSLLVPTSSAVSFIIGIAVRRIPLLMEERCRDRIAAIFASEYGTKSSR